MQLVGKLLASYTATIHVPLKATDNSFLDVGFNSSTVIMLLLKYEPKVEHCLQDEGVQEEECNFGLTIQKGELFKLLTVCLWLIRVFQMEESHQTIGDFIRNLPKQEIIALTLYMLLHLEEMSSLVLYKEGET